MMLSVEWCQLSITAIINLYCIRFNTNALVIIVFNT